ncbi:hybrid sensor histidine kinase/response regulator transcription factor [Pedobacter cryophilus]|uniref:histidine kinase n=1 Tax=Pedobacter cryophilus TaxID=2571271 RepID=A0A4U1BVL7_9SPHI|nr:hybrid sensor histidine kinase/response regulator transcription factor [Pedobacter cryophilus]TKB96247.1 response regulator [Pedobacter cryophilus]
MHYFKKHWIIFILLTSFLTANAQLKSRLRHYSTEDGLSHDGVLCITKDKEGFMWFGTWDGINRYDGNQFITYKARPGDRSSLKNNKIRSIVEDKIGYLWVETYDNKVYRFDKRTEQFLAINKSVNGGNLKDIVVSKLIATSLGDTWLITEEQGLLCAVYDEETKLPKVYSYQKGKKGGFGIPSNHINFLIEDKTKKIWVGTDEGLFCLVKRNGKYVQYLKRQNSEKILKSNYNVTCVTGKNNLLYFGTSSGEIIIYNTKERVFKIKNLVKGANINDICVAKSGQIYISTSKQGLLVMNPKSLQFEVLKMDGQSNLLSLYEDKSGNIWIEPTTPGIIRYNPYKKVFKLYVHQIEEVPEQLITKTYQDKNYTVFEDVNGVLWTSMKGGGFGYYDEERNEIAYFYNKPGSSDQQLSNVVTTVFSDKTGVLWLSTRFGGINKAIFTGNNFQHQQLEPQSLKRYDNEVRAIYEDSKKRIWVASKIGNLYVFDKGKKIQNIFKNISTAKIGSIYAIKESKNGIIWIGTKGQGLLMAKPLNKERTSYEVTRFLNDKKDSNSLSSDMIYAILEDAKGRIWIGTFGGGLNLIEEKNNKIIFKNANNYFKNYPIATSNVIRYLEEGADGTIWIATTDGLLRFNPESSKNGDYQFYRSSKIPGDINSLGNNDVQVIHKNLDGQMWIGTFGGGLNKVIGRPKINDKLRFEIYTKEQGLPNDIVLSMVDDKNGNLWLATENGLSKFNINQKTFRNYDSYDGLPKEGFSESACFRSASGALYFGCIYGYISFFPDKITSKKYNTEIALTNLQLYNKDIIAGAPGSPLSFSLNKTNKIVLDYNQDVLSLDYSVLDFRANSNINYAFILEGYDKAWHFVKNQRKATYTHLSSGDYIFKVKSLNKDLFTNIPEKSIAITILPPPWLTIWAYLLYAILLVVLIVMARRIIITMIRLRNKVTVERKLTDLKLQFFTNISHELRTPLTLIVNPLSQIAKTEQLSEKGKEYMLVVNKNANRMVRFINQLLDFRKIQSGKIQLKVSEVEVVAFVKDIAAYFNELAEEKNIKFLIHSDVETFFVWIDEEKIDIVVYNLLSNAFKFTPPNKIIDIQIDCASYPDKFIIKITDQGVGVPESKLAEIFELYYEGENHDQSQKGTGIGLALSKDIILNHKGKIIAQNNEEGMSFIIELNKGSMSFTSVDMLEKENDERHSLLLQHPENKTIFSANDSIDKSIADKEKPVVLLVEDNTDLRKFLADQLIDFYRITEAADGLQGLNTALEILPDLIISDVMMPNMDGIEMLDKLKNNLTTSHIPVILLTAKSSIENQINGLKYGADFYITKPFHVDHILVSMQNLIMQRKNLYKKFLEERKIFKLEPGEIIITSKDEKFLKEVIAIVENSMADPQFNIDSVAAAIAMGRTTFFKKLKCLTNRSPVEFVRDMRLKRGKQLLDAGEHTISEIAYMIGFSSSGYFSTCFKEEYKISPSDYQKNRNENNS